MQLVNHTPFPAMIFRGGIEGNRLFGAVICRVTYDIAGTELKVSAEQTWKVSPPPWECEYGPMDSDEVFYRGGVDLFAFGSARPDRGEATSMDVTVELGDTFRTSLKVFGPRLWRKESRGLVPSPPYPFREIPLTLAYAYGGKDDWDGLPVPFPSNPAGKGFYLEEANAVGRELPNIEDPKNLIRRWDDRPDPVGLTPCGMAFGPRLQRSVVFDEKTGDLLELKPTLFNAAFPDMVAPSAKAGDRMRITGMSAAGPVEFALPSSGLMVKLGFGKDIVFREPAVDQIGVEVDRRRAFITYRYPFRYVLVPLVKRSCELFSEG
jgi:hypothetical protein